MDITRRVAQGSSLRLHSRIYLPLERRLLFEVSLANFVEMQVHCIVVFAIHVAFSHNFLVVFSFMIRMFAFVAIFFAARMTHYCVFFKRLPED